MALDVHILLKLGRSTQDQGLLDGCRAYCQHHELPWHLSIRREIFEQRGSELISASKNFAGFIGFNFLDCDVNTLAACQVPIASMDPPVVDAGINWSTVSIDHARTADLLAGVIKKNGYRSLGLVGRPNYDSGVFRYMADHISGIGVQRYDKGRRDFADADGKERDLLEWLRGLHRPALILAGQDREAVWILELCRRHGLRVPEVLSVIGVDDDRWVCDKAVPSLSSVHIPWQQAGWQLAAHMHRQLHGERPEPSTVMPLRITERKSTRRLVIADALVDGICQTCINSLTSSLTSFPSLTQIVAEHNVSRQTIHRRFKKALGCGFEAWWLHYRLERAIELLQAQPDCQLDAMARQCGFANSETFRHAFRRQFKLSPTNFSRLYA